MAIKQLALFWRINNFTGACIFQSLQKHLYKSAYQTPFLTHLFSPKSSVVRICRFRKKGILFSRFCPANVVERCVMFQTNHDRYQPMPKARKNEKPIPMIQGAPSPASQITSTISLPHTGISWIRWRCSRLSTIVCIFSSRG